ncbi:ATP-binding protein [Glaciihabitans sp. INWT7]|uniref:AAA family ATPase n=1 Tax=Glaciihabitans sp. INWT7 TaxID=2596912 RepID=UPI0016267F44|nr:AAA family ATPase [Glaciihabitans sp. INWT7]QNE47880.1 ATP-binding protein [Glaciihabitans sp. INWT7]
MDDPTREFLSTFQRFMSEVVNQVSVDSSDLTPLGAVVQDFLGTDISTLPAITHGLPAHRLVDADLALAELGRDSGQPPIGVSGGQQREHLPLSELLFSPYGRFSPAPIDYLSIADGPETARRVIAFGLHRITFEGHPVVVLERAAQPQFGRPGAQLEILSRDTETSSRFLDEFSRLVLSLSVLRGKVLSFTGNEYGNSSAGATFLHRPAVDADDVVLPPGVLETVVRHVVGIGEQREHLLAAGQHLKRGVLLYGPPGTGKTLTVRHLLSRTPGTTAVLLTGSSIQFITEAAELARAMQPAIVVLEDVDLVAEERGMHGPQPLLFAVLDALDGLEGDADVTFILTTNRVQVLERALAERPGRVDLAVEIPLPDASSRRRLFRHYAGGLPLTTEATDAAADRATETTGSFAKELVRRAVLTAAEQHRAVTDEDLSASLDGLLEAGTQLARNLLGGGAAPENDGRSPRQWGAYAPLSPGSTLG